MFKIIKYKKKIVSLAFECQNNLKLTAMLFLLTYAVLNKLNLNCLKTKSNFLNFTRSSQQLNKQSTEDSQKKKRKNVNQKIQKFLNTLHPLTPKQNDAITQKKKTGNLPTEIKITKKKKALDILSYIDYAFGPKKKKHKIN